MLGPYIPFLSFIVLIFAWNVPLVSLIFMKRSLVFPILLFSSILCIDLEEGFLISPWYSLELCIQIGISFLFSFAFSSSSFLFVKPSQTTVLPFCISFSWIWFWSLPPVQCHEPPSIVLQALSLSELIPWIYLVTCSTSLKPASHSSCAFLPSFFSVLCVMFKYYFSFLFQLTIYVYGTVPYVLLSIFFFLNTVPPMK